VNVTKVRSVHVSFTNVVPGVLKRDAAEVEGLSRGEQPHDKRAILDHFRLQSHLSTKRVGISWLKMLGINGEWESNSVGGDSWLVVFLNEAGPPLAFVGCLGGGLV
jgi:hypothetical protein